MTHKRAEKVEGQGSCGEQACAEFSECPHHIGTYNKGDAGSETI